MPSPQVVSLTDSKSNETQQTAPPGPLPRHYVRRLWRKTYGWSPESGFCTFTDSYTGDVMYIVEASADTLLVKKGSRELGRVDWAGRPGKLLDRSNYRFASKGFSTTGSVKSLLPKSTFTATRTFVAPDTMTYRFKLLTYSGNMTYMYRNLMIDSREEPVATTERMMEGDGKLSDINYPFYLSHAGLEIEEFVVFTLAILDVIAPVSTA